MAHLITLITDFGIEDTYAGVLKGVILSISPGCRIVDITHQIPPQDVRAACFALSTAYAYFPKGTIHLVIVDPGVGGKRRPLLIETEDYFFIGPDNGVFTAILVKPGLKSVIEITNREYFPARSEQHLSWPGYFCSRSCPLCKRLPLFTVWHPGF